jgi:hypothetical protein
MEKEGTLLKSLRFPLIGLGGLSLLAAIWAGLVRMGWNLVVPTRSFPAAHGPLMIVGFLGTVIGLERAVASKKPWAYGAPLFAALSALVQLAGLPARWSQSFAVISAVILVAIFCFLWWQQHESYMVIIGLGALIWLIGNSLWFYGYPYFIVAAWWAGFLVLTIAGERLELSRLRRLSVGSRMMFFFAIAAFVLGLASMSVSQPGSRVAGIGLIAIAAWLLRWDVAWRTLRIAGLPRFMAVALLSGYVWLLAAGVLWIIYAGDFVGGPRYDAMLHSLFLGFVFTMIFAHAPIILPSVMDVSMPFQDSFYAHLVLLHLSLFLRIGADLTRSQPARMWGGLLNVAAILLFLANNIRAVAIGNKAAYSQGGR